jgi:hypothetical protein
VKTHLPAVAMIVAIGFVGCNSEGSEENSEPPSLSGQELVDAANEICSNHAGALASATAGVYRALERAAPRFDQRARLRLGEAYDEVSSALVSLGAELRRLQAPTTVERDFMRYVELLFRGSESLARASEAVEVVAPDLYRFAVSELSKFNRRMKHAAVAAGDLGLDACGGFDTEPPKGQILS